MSMALDAGSSRKGEATSGDHWLDDASESGSAAGALGARYTGDQAPGWLRRLQARTVAVDILIISIVVAAGILLYRGDEAGELAAGLGWVASTAVAGGIGLVWILALAVNGAWDRNILGAGSGEYRRIFNASVGVFLLVVTASYLARVELARGYVAIVFPAGIVALILGRVWARHRLHQRRRRDRDMNNVLVIGGALSAQRLADELARAPDEGLRVTGICVPTADVDAGDDSAVVSERDQIRSAIRCADAHIVAVAPSEEFGSEQVRALAWDLEGTGIKLALAPALTDVAGPRVHIKPVSGLPLMYVEEPRFRGPKLVAKTMLDWTGGLVALALLAPVMLVAAILIKTEDGGSVFFRQTRVGMDGRHFRIVKFRSMKQGSDSKVGTVRAEHGQTDSVFFKSASDSRITRVGRFLRKTSIDELPQLFNIFAGDMSLVGPRPLVPGEGAGVDNFLERRMLVKPGLTGLWQVSGRSDTSTEARIRLDMFYVENWSVAGDMAILGRTVLAVAARRGAY
jgi:exopolysaccharide biosynthesis polyprenyl glycosylphosphotransferase